MPRIPTYEGPQVRSEALRPVYQRTPDVMGGFRETAQALAAGAEMVDRRIERDARAQADAAELEVRQSFQNERSRLREKYKGDQADQYKVELDTFWNKAREEYGKKLSPMAQQLASNRFGTLKLQSDADALGYVEGEKRKFRELNFRALQDQRLADVTRDITPATAATMSRTASEALEKSAIDYAVSEGGNAEIGQTMARPLIAKLHADVAVALASKPGGAKAAQEYLREFGSAIPLDVRSRLDEAITTTANNEAGQDFARSVATLPYAERLKRAGEITNPEQKKAALVAIDADEVRIQRARTQQADQAYGALRLGVLQGREPTPIEMQALASIDANKAADLQAVVLAKRKADKDAAKGESVKTNWATYQSLSEAIGRGERVEVYKYADRLAASEIEKLIDRQTKQSDPAKAPEVATTEQQLSAFLASQRFDDREKGLFRDAVYDELNVFLKRNKREATYDERKSIIDKLNTEIVTTRGVTSWFDSKDPTYKASPELRRRTMDEGATPQAAAPGRPAEFVVGREYTDAAGNKAIYQGSGRWQPVVQQPRAAPAPAPAARPAAAPVAPAPAAIAPGVQLPPMPRPAAPAAAPVVAPAAVAAPAPVAPAPIAPGVALPAMRSPAAPTPVAAPTGRANPSVSVPAPVAAPTPAPAAAPAATPAPAPRRAPAAPAPITSVNIAGIEPVQAIAAEGLVGASPERLAEAQTQITTARTSIEGMRKAVDALEKSGDRTGALRLRTEVLRAEAAVTQARDQLREERRRPLEIDLATERELRTTAQRALANATTAPMRRELGKQLAEHEREIQRLEQELQAALRF